MTPLNLFKKLFRVNQMEQLTNMPHNGGRVGGLKFFDLLILHSGHSMGYTKVDMHF